ncbi:MAG TPA: hypothetical protein VKK81_23840 [Candidatus Binatia bacterium]|nr:hypothetical protein [Candidatus Binatia bacterium]
MNTAIVTYAGNSRAANDPWVLYREDFTEPIEVPRIPVHLQSTACTEVGLLWVQAMVAAVNEPQPVSSVEGVESAARTVLGSAEAESRRRADLAIRLLDEWMADESGYDEETWPELKTALDRDRLSSRRFFDE